MAEAIIGSYDPTTGERKESTWRYEPVQPPSPGLMTPERANALLNYTAQTDPKSVPALYRRLEATMEYQRRIAAGQKPHEAFDPMIASGLLSSGGGAASMLRAITPKPVNPRDEVLLEIDKARRDEMLRKSKLPTEPEVKEFEGQKFLRVPGSTAIHRLTPPPQTESVVEKFEVTPATPGKPGFFGIGRQEAVPESKKLVGQTVTRKVPVGAPTPLSAVAADNKPSNEVIRLTKDGRKAVYDADTKQFIRYAD